MTTTVETMMPPAVCRNPFSLVHITDMARRKVGSWYVGRSMTSGSCGTARHNVPRSTNPTRISRAMEMTYIQKTTLPA